VTSRERLVGLLALLLLLADVRAVVALRDDQRCASSAVLRRADGVDATLTLAGGLRVGADLRGTAVISNAGPATVRVLHVGAVLVEPSASTPLTWTGDGADQQVTLRPGSVAQVSFVVHTARCRDGGPVPAGWYEITLVLLTDVGELRAGVRAAVLS
jgi:hypothetical protein